MIIAVTGHRPEELGGREEEIADLFEDAFRQYKPEKIIVGMAAGIDLLVGLVALNLGIPFIAARPWAGHTPRKGDESVYEALVAQADAVVNVSAAMHYEGPWVYHKRNEWMVDNATHVVAWWNGKPAGGTYACLRYAMKTQTPIRNIYAEILSV